MCQYFSIDLHNSRGAWSNTVDMENIPGPLSLGVSVFSYLSASYPPSASPTSMSFLILARDQDQKLSMHWGKSESSASHGRLASLLLSLHSIDSIGEGLTVRIDLLPAGICEIEKL